MSSYRTTKLYISYRTQTVLRGLKNKVILEQIFLPLQKKKKLETRQSFKVVNLFENSQPAHKHSVKCGQGKFNIFSLENSATYII